MTDDLLRLSRVDVDLGINFRPSSSCALNQKREPIPEGAAQFGRVATGGQR